MNWMWDVPRGSCVPPPNGTILEGHWSHPQTCIFPVHLSTTRWGCFSDTISQVTMEWALWSHKPHAPISSNLCCFYQVFLSQKWKKKKQPNFQTSMPCHLWDEVWTETQLGKLSLQAPTMQKADRDTCPWSHSLLPQIDSTQATGLGRTGWHQIPSWACSTLWLKQRVKYFHVR